MRFLGKNSDWSEKQSKGQTAQTSVATVGTMTASSHSVKKKMNRLSYHIRNVPVLSTIEMSPGCVSRCP
jgi:hypothetical protein